MRYGLEEQTIRDIQKALAKHPIIDKAVLYGSRAKGTNKQGSDIDLCLFGESLNQKILYQIETTLDDLGLPYRFDLCAYQALSNNDLIEHIDRVGFFSTTDMFRARYSVI
jgi:predicted nucleotidyltransferase